MPYSNYRPRTSNERILLRFGIAMLVVVVMLFISGASVKAAWGMYKTFDVAASEREAAETKLADLRSEHTEMVATLAQFDTSRGVEAAVRERFGVVRPGEGEIHIVREEGASGAVVKDDSSNPFSRLFHALFTW